ncbi:MAG: iron complex transport system substrate-binding protein [Janthinobacterium sp.]|jgi:iron complex transport system substrate-binding protein
MLEWSRLLRVASVALLCLMFSVSHAAIEVQDDAGHTVVLQQPAQRIISMAPHVTELLFAAGGGNRVVGAMNFSDYPAAAKRLPQIGSNAQVDIERVIALKPDLVIVWQSGTAARQIEQMRQLGLPIFYSEPQQLDDIATSLLRFGQLMGTDAVAQEAARTFRQQIAALTKQYAQRPPVRVFYQIWDQPLYTLGGRHIVSAAIGLCGGQNIFGAFKVAAPSVGIEAVLVANPEVILGGLLHEQREQSERGIDLWRPYASLLAVKRGNLFRLDGQLLMRAGPRMAQGIALMCEKLELARQRRQASVHGEL